MKHMKQSQTKQLTQAHKGHLHPSQFITAGKSSFDLCSVNQGKMCNLSVALCSYLKGS